MSSDANHLLEKAIERLTNDSDTIMLLMEIEEALRASGRADVADKLDKLQKDITAWYAGAGTPNPERGPLTDPFLENYEEISSRRVNALLAEIENSLAGELKQKFSAFAKEAKIPEAQNAAQPAAKARKIGPGS